MMAGVPTGVTASWIISRCTCTYSNAVGGLVRWLYLGCSVLVAMAAVSSTTRGMLGLITVYTVK
jgi:hypothetical protein